MTSFRDMNIRTKLYSVFGASIVFVLLIIATGVINMQRMKADSREVYYRTFVQAQEFIRLRESIEDARRQVLMYLNSREIASAPEYEREIMEASRAVDEDLLFISQSGVFGADPGGAINELQGLWEEFKKARDTALLPAAREGRWDLASKIAVTEQQKRFKRLDEISDYMISFSNAEAVRAQKFIEHRFSSSIKIFFVITLAGLVTALGLLRYISKDIAGRLGVISERLSSLEEGKLEQDLKVGGSDEIGAVASGINKLSRHLYEDKVAQDQYLNLLEWNWLEKEEKSKELEDANRNLSSAKAELSAKNVELEASLSEIREAHQKLADTKAQMVQSEKMASIGQLAAGVAHEINNPVGFVNSNLNTLAGYIVDFTKLFQMCSTLEGALREERTEAAKKIAAKIREFREEVGLEFEAEDAGRIISESKDGIDRILSIVRALKDFSHPDASGVAEFDINKCIDNVVKIAWNEIKYKVELRKDYGVIPPVPCRPQQISQVFLNILVNASQAIKERGRIDIRTYTEDGHAAVEIADNGIGMPEDVVKRIFDPFFTTKPVGKGTGLGLSIAYGIVTEHKGRIEVKSALGEGTTFKILLPLSGQAEAA